MASQANPIMADGVAEGVRRPTGRWRGGPAAASVPAASDDVAMGAPEAMPSEPPRDVSEQVAMPPDSTPSQSAAEPAQTTTGATTTTVAAELVDPKAFFDSICKCGSQKSFKECICDTAMFIKRAVTEASQEEPQWDSLKVLLNDLESQTKRRRLSGTSGIQ